MRRAPMRIDYQCKGIGSAFSPTFHPGEIFPQIPERTEDRIIHKIAYIIIYQPATGLSPHESPFIGAEIILPMSTGLGMKHQARQLPNFLRSAFIVHHNYHISICRQGRHIMQHGLPYHALRVISGKKEKPFHKLNGTFSSWHRQSFQE